MTVYIVCSLFIGLILGVVLARIIFKPKYAGTLMLCKMKPSEPLTLYLELAEDAENLYHCEYVYFKTKRI